MKKILFLTTIMLVLLTSCAVDVSHADRQSWDNLSTTEKQLFNASVYDSTIIKDAIIIEDRVIIFDAVNDDFIEIANVDPMVTAIIIGCIVLLILLFIAGIMYISNS